jgi:uncharacterized membrane protein
VTTTEEFGYNERASKRTALVSSLLCLVGTVVSSYLTYAHYTTPKVLACSDKGLVNCAKVTTSAYSHILGVPVSDIGLGYFLVMAALCARRAWPGSRALRATRVLVATSGVGFVMWLLYAELFRLDAICLYCTVVHVVTVLLFITITLGTAATGHVSDDDVSEQDLEEVNVGRADSLGAALPHA